MAELESSYNWEYHDSRSYRPMYSSLKNLSKIIAYLGILLWAIYTYEGFLYSSGKIPSGRTVESLLVYGTYFCTPKGKITSVDKVLLLCISQLIISLCLLIGVTKVYKPILLICWALMSGFLLIRIHRFVFSDCSWDVQLILSLIYAFFEICVILSFIKKIKRHEGHISQSLRATHNTQLNLQEFNQSGSQNLHHLEATANPVSLVTSVPLYEDFSAQSYNSLIHIRHIDSTDCPPSYDDIFNDSPPSYDDIFNDSPPSYEDCITADPSMDLQG